MRWVTTTATTLGILFAVATLKADHGYNPYPGAVATDKTHRHPQSPNRPNTDARAGNPQCLSHFAKVPPRYDSHYMGGWIGGGKLTLFPSHRQGRDIMNDGTWGTDYVLFGRRPGRVFLDWWHGRPGEPRMGTYDANGVPVPDPLAAHYIQKLLTGGREKHEGEGGEGGEGH